MRGLNQRGSRFGEFIGGPEGIRTPGLVSAIHALSQLSYGPTAVARSADLRV